MDKHGEYVKCEMYVDEERNKTEKCSQWQYIYDDIGPTIVSQVPALWFYTINLHKLVLLNSSGLLVLFSLATVIIMLKCLKLHLSQMLRSFGYSGTWSVSMLI